MRRAAETQLIGHSEATHSVREIPSRDTFAPSAFVHNGIQQSTAVGILLQ